MENKLIKLGKKHAEALSTYLNLYNYYIDKKDTAKEDDYYLAVGLFVKSVKQWWKEGNTVKRKKKEETK